MHHHVRKMRARLPLLGLETGPPGTVASLRSVLGHALSTGLTRQPRRLPRSFLSSACCSSEASPTSPSSAPSPASHYRMLRFRLRNARTIAVRAISHSPAAPVFPLSAHSALLLAPHTCCWVAPNPPLSRIATTDATLLNGSERGHQHPFKADILAHPQCEVGHSTG